MKKKIFVLSVAFIATAGSVFSMARDNVQKPSEEYYKQQMINADQELVKVIAERKAIRNRLFKYQKKNHINNNYDPFKDKSIAKTHVSFAVQYDVSPVLVDQVFNLLNTNDLKTIDQSF